MSDPTLSPSRVAEHLAAATQELVRTVDGLHRDALAEPSLLPGWTRAHVVAHLACNAEGLSGVLNGVLQEEPRSMYVSDEQRDADIAELAAESAEVLRERFLAGATEMADALERMPEDAWTGDFERTPDGVLFPLDKVPMMRWREVEVHHADLGAGYGPHDWPAPFVGVVLDTVVADRGSDASFTLALPGGERVVGGGGPPVVRGGAADVAWWLLGRGRGEGLASEQGLPRLGAWR